MESIIERSIAKSALTFPCDVSGARSAALIVHGRPEHLFTQTISKGRARLEEITTVGKVRYGDYPEKGSTRLSAITLISGITDFARLENMKRRVEQLAWEEPVVQAAPTDGVAEHSPV